MAQRLSNGISTGRRFSAILAVATCLALISGIHRRTVSRRGWRDVNIGEAWRGQQGKGGSPLSLDSRLLILDMWTRPSDFDDHLPIVIPSSHPFSRSLSFSMASSQAAWPGSLACSRCPIVQEGKKPDG